MIDCPALHERCHGKGYPFGERVPSKIRMTCSVSSDFAFLPNAAPPAFVSLTYDAWTNSYGAVAAVMENGKKLGVKPGEFEVVEWHNLSEA